MKEDKGKKTVLIQFRTPRRWRLILDEMLDELGGASSGSRSSYIRDLVSFETGLWRKSPYVCPQGGHFVLVTERGDFFYHGVEGLRLNSPVAQLSAGLEMKEEKREYYYERYKGGAAHAEIKKHWLLNRFTVWSDRAPGPEIIEDASDEDGVTSKSVLLDIGLPNGSLITRETCVVLEDYAQYREDGRASTRPESKYDRADFCIDIPTRKLEIMVVVASGLFRNTPDLEPNLTFELHNRENVAYQLKDLDWLKEHTRLQRLGSVFPPQSDPDDFYESSRHHIEQSFERFRARLRDLSAEIPASKRDLVEQVRLPDRYLFYRLSTEATHVGLIFSVKWAKPRRAR